MTLPENGWHHEEACMLSVNLGQEVSDQQAPEVKFYVFYYVCVYGLQVTRVVGRHRKIIFTFCSHKISRVRGTIFRFSGPVLVSRRVKNCVKKGPVIQDFLFTL